MLSVSRKRKESEAWGAWVYFVSTAYECFSYPEKLKISIFVVILKSIQMSVLIARVAGPSMLNWNFALVSSCHIRFPLSE